MSLSSKLKAWVDSAAGQARIQKTIEKYHREGRTTTASGHSLVPEKTIEEASAKFIQVLRDTAASHDLPASVMSHIEEMHAVKPIQTKTGFEIPLFFGGDLHRDSLENDATDYDGIDNIVALFNNGYTASDYVYGWWDGHTPTGSAVSRSLYDDDYTWVRSKIQRGSLRFIQQAIDDFNGNYGSQYNITAIVAADIYNE